MSIIEGMVTYCMGSARQKRGYFRNMRDTVMLDNIEVMFCVSENGLNYFAYGDVPFAAFTVAEYVKYRRALCGDGDVEYGRALSRLGIPADKRLCKLTPAEMRCVMYVEKTGGVDLDKTVVINLDGAKYSRRSATALARLLRVCHNAYVCITDNRFLRRAPKDCGQLLFGKPAKRKRPSFYTAKLLAEKINAKRVAVM